MDFEIKITGNGTPAEIIKSLLGIIGGIQEAIDSNQETAILDGAEWEDETLMTEINAE